LGSARLGLAVRLGHGVVVLERLIDSGRRPAGSVAAGQCVEPARLVEGIELVEATDVLVADENLRTVRRPPLRASMPSRSAGSSSSLISRKARFLRASSARARSQ